jgi:hypothetical protein
MMRYRKEVKESARMNSMMQNGHKRITTSTRNIRGRDHQESTLRTNERIDKKIKMKMDMKINIKDRRREEEY